MTRSSHVRDDEWGTHASGMTVLWGRDAPRSGHTQKVVAYVALRPKSLLYGCDYLPPSDVRASPHETLSVAAMVARTVRVAMISVVAPMSPSSSMVRMACT